MELKYKNIHQQLIDDCKAGNSQAQFKIYQYYYKAMYNTCYRMLNNSYEAEDIMQDAFLQAFRNITRYKEEASFGAWLKKIVINKTLDFLRKNKINFDEINDQTTTILDKTEEEHCDEYTEKTNEKINIIKKIISEMPDKQRILLTLYLFEGYDHEEISKLLDMSSSAVRTGYSRAKSKLQELLKLQNIENYG